MAGVFLFLRLKVALRKSAPFKLVLISILNPKCLKILILSFLVLSVSGPLQFRRIMSPSSWYKQVSFLFILSAEIDLEKFQTTRMFLHYRSFPLSHRSLLVTLSLSMVFPCQIVKIFNNI